MDEQVPQEMVTHLIMHETCSTEKSVAEGIKGSCTQRFFGVSEGRDSEDVLIKGKTQVSKYVLT